MMGVTVDDSVHPYRVTVSHEAMTRYGLVAVTAAILQEYCTLLKLEFPDCFLKTYASLIVRNGGLIESVIIKGAIGAFKGDGLTVVLRPFSQDTQSTVFGAAVNTPEGPKVVYINSLAPRGRAHVTAYHELAHIAEYLCRIRVDHQSLHILSVHVASEVAALIPLFKKALPYGIHR